MVVFVYKGGEDVGGNMEGVVKNEVGGERELFMYWDGGKEER